MRNVLSRMKNQFSDFYLSSYCEISSKIGSFEYKNGLNPGYGHADPPPRSEVVETL